MKKISAVIVGDSIAPSGDRITTMLMTFPRSILAELNTHRMFSRNSSSSRAIPFNKMVETVKNEPFIPIAWQKDHKGMQGVEYFTKEHEINLLRDNWLEARNNAVEEAVNLSNIGVTKQICNRLLEPFMWHTALVTSTEWQNFFEQRCPEYEIPNMTEGEEFYDKTFKSRKDVIHAMTVSTTDNYEGSIETAKTLSEVDWLMTNKGQAEIHMMALAEAVWDAMNESVPKPVQAGLWHIPFVDKIDYGKLNFDTPELGWHDVSQKAIPLQVKVSTSMCARTSYTTIGEEKEINYQNLIAIHDRMISAKPIHYSPFEHCARVMSRHEFEGFYKGFADKDTTEEEDEANTGWCNNLRGFIPYRYMIESKYES